MQDECVPQRESQVNNQMACIEKELSRSEKMQQNVIDRLGSVCQPARPVEGEPKNKEVKALVLLAEHLRGFAARLENQSNQYEEMLHGLEL